MVIYLRCWWERCGYYRLHLEEIFSRFFLTITWSILVHLAWPRAHFDHTGEGYKMICSEIHQTCGLPILNTTTDQCPTTVEEKVAMWAVPYHEAIGALNWIAVGTWPDIVFVVGQLVHFMENPGRVHWEAVKHVSDIWKGHKIGSWYMEEVKIEVWKGSWMLMVPCRSIGGQSPGT